MLPYIMLHQVSTEITTTNLPHHLSAKCLYANRNLKMKNTNTEAQQSIKLMPFEKLEFIFWHTKFIAIKIASLVVCSSTF